MSDESSLAHYRVVGIRRNGIRDVRSENLTRVTAEAVQVALLASRVYRRVLIERQPNGKSRKGIA